MIIYPAILQNGLEEVRSLGDGYSIKLIWNQAYTTIHNYKVGYKIYYSTNKDTVFSEGTKYISLADTVSATITDLIPGQLYYFSVRAFEYDDNLEDLINILPTAYDDLKLIPSSILRSNITNEDTIIPLLDTSDFPTSGVVKIGAEAVFYSSIDYLNNNLLVQSTNNVSSSLIWQGDGYYSRSAGNDGYLIGLELIDPTAISQTWSIKCIFIQYDSLNQPIPGTAKFISVGSISGIKTDGYTNPYIWTADGYEISNEVFRLSILENTVFGLGQYFTIQVLGSETIDGGRGYNGTIARNHDVSGFDGYVTWSPIINYVIYGEDTLNDRIYMGQSRFEYPQYAYTADDGYRQVTKDLLTTDLSISDEYNIEAPEYDYAGYHRTDPVQLLTGTCVGSYIGGESGCIDKYGNVNLVRGLSLQDQNINRQNLLLSIVGRPAVLIKRMRTGITCPCYLSSSEYPDDRCPLCLGTKFITGYEQYFYPKSSDGRIKIRVGPTDEKLKMLESGLESDFILDCWTSTVPTIKDRDIIVLFDQEDNEEFRYEVTSTTRNNTIVGLNGGQKFKIQRIRKYDPAYQIRIIRNTQHYPTKLNTSISSISALPPHIHEIVVNENITSISQINQTTSISQGHNHVVKDGVVIATVGHTHIITLS